MKTLFVPRDSGFEVFGVAGNGHLRHGWYDAEGWRDYEPAGDLTGIATLVSVVHRGSLNVFTIGDAGTLGHVRAECGGWRSGGVAFDGTVAKLAVGVSVHDKLELFVADDEGTLHHAASADGGRTWTAWESNFADAPKAEDVFVGGSNFREVFIIRRGDKALWHNRSHGTGWQDHWRALG